MVERRAVRYLTDAGDPGRIIRTAIDRGRAGGHLSFSQIVCPGPDRAADDPRRGQPPLPGGHWTARARFRHDAPMWRELIEQHTSRARFASPVTEQALYRAEEALGHLLPDDLVKLLGETDGVIDANGYNLVFSAEQLVQGNLEVRTYPALKRLYMSFDQLLFFSDVPGDGNLFAYALVPEGRPDIFVWDHRTDNRRCVAPSLEHFIEAWLTGHIQL